MQVFNRYVSGRSLTVFGFETALVTATILLATYANGSAEPSGSLFWRVVLITGICELCLYYNDVYDLTVVRSLSELASRGLKGVGIASIALGIVAMVMPDVMISSEAYLMAIGVLLVTIPLWRLAFNGVSNDSHLEHS